MFGKGLSVEICKVIFKILCLFDLMGKLNCNLFCLLSYFGCSSKFVLGWLMVFLFLIEIFLFFYLLKVFCLFFIFVRL